MKIRLVSLFLVVVLISLGSISCGKSAAGSDEVAVLDTSYGRIVIEFFPDVAPKHVANFKELATEGFFNGTKFHRLVKSQTGPVAIQGGDPNTINGDVSTWGKGQPGQKTVPAEFSQTLKHEPGIVSAARKGNDENSATSQFFICVGNEPQWDGKYSIFGRVIEGQHVADLIARAPVWPKTDRPMDPVVLKSVTLVKRDQWNAEAAQKEHSNP